MRTGEVRLPGISWLTPLAEVAMIVHKKMLGVLMGLMLAGAAPAAEPKTEPEPALVHEEWMKLFMQSTRVTEKMCKEAAGDGNLPFFKSINEQDFDLIVACALKAQWAAYAGGPLF